MTIFLYVFGFLCAHESLQWGWSLGTHSLWMKNHESIIRCPDVNYRMVGIASIMSSLLTACILPWMIFLIIHGSSHLLVCLFIGTTVNLSHIHFMALLARCTSMPIECWPLLSRFMSKYIVRKIMDRRSVDNPSITIHRRRKEDKEDDILELHKEE